MLSMLYFELKLLRRQKILFVAMLLLPIYFLAFTVILDRAFLIIQSIPFLFGWGLPGHITSMKRYRQFESLFALSVIPKDIFVGNVLSLGIYYSYIFLVNLPLYLPGISIGSMIELRALFLLALLLIAAKCLASYLAMLIRRIYLIQWAVMLVYMLAIFSLRYIQRMAEHPYAWMVLPICLTIIAITYVMTTRLSKERVILSSE